MGKLLRGVTLLAILLAGVIPAAASAQPAAPPADARPNIVLILTDDQDSMMNSMEAMPLTRALIGDQGATLTNFLAPVPLCCPARASLLLGQYAHNTQILTNTPPTGGFQRFYDLGLENVTVGKALHDAGYRTGLMGKYLNGYPNPNDPTHIPPGWDTWWAPITDSAYSSYDYTVNDNGTLVSYGHQPEDYITDVLAGQALDFIDPAVQDPRPFFMMVSVYAPHSPFIPAPRHANLYPDAQVPRNPSFNESDMSDKPPFMQPFPLLNDATIAEYDANQRARWQMLAAVDELVAGVVTSLEAQDLLNNTYIIFASDNGLHMGQHRFVRGKGTPYEEDVLAPFMARGPGIPAGVTRSGLGMIIDLAPTFADIADAPLAAPSDGRSLLPLLYDGAPGAWRQVALIEHWQPAPLPPNLVGRIPLEPEDPSDLQLRAFASSRAADTPDYLGLRSESFKMIARPGTYELYDLANDRFEIYNQWPDAAPVMRAALQAWLSQLDSCAGESCRTLDAQTPPAWTLTYRRQDINRDGQVNVLDISAVAQCWQQTVAGSCGDRHDLDYDGNIDVVDVQQVAASFNTP